MSEKIVETKNIKNQEIVEILEKYNKYGHLKFDDLQTFRNYRDEIRDVLNRKNATLRMGFINGLTAEHYSYLEAEVEEINYINKYKIYNSTLVTLQEMHGTLYGLWSKENSGYSNNAYFDFIALVKQVNAYWEIENPYKAPNKIAYGWKFCMDKGNSYYDKGWKLYLWGCIKNYLIKNGIEFTKEESLKVRKIVGLVDIYDTTE